VDLHYFHGDLDGQQGLLADLDEVELRYGCPCCDNEYGTVQYFDVDMEIWVIEIDWLRIPLILYSAAILM